ncbi:MAG: hypothetical protein ACLR2E_02715 [Lachnospiraceae bacterium]
MLASEKDGKVLGVEDPDGVDAPDCKFVKGRFGPDIMPFVRVNSVEIEGKQVVEINVTTGTNRLAIIFGEKGLKLP